ncbi:unnamed protein product [Trichobilharzia szidati]|nr:unnamed protein product [Trichobilharzia szidati]
MDKVCNSYLVGATSKNTLIRASTVPPVNPSEIEITRQSDDRVHNIFLDPMGWHTIISMQSGMNFYINRGMKKVRPLNKTRDHLFDSVAWNQHNVNELSTQEILIGTNDGLIFETVLMFNEDSFFGSGSIEQYWVQMINLGHSVTGIEVIRFPIGSANVLVGEPQRCVVFATTPGRMYQFAGWINTNTSITGSILSHLASNTTISSSVASNTATVVPSGHRSSLVNEYNQQSTGAQNTTIFPNITGLFYGVFNSDDKLPAGSKVTEFPGSFGYSDLKLYRNPNDELPSKFAWMTGPGIYFGHIKTEQLSMPPFTKLSVNDQSSSDMKSFPSEITSSTTGPLPQPPPPPSTEDLDDPNRLKDVFSGRGVNLTRNTKLIPYPIIHMLERPGIPLGICMTEFHVIIIYMDRIKAVNTLDGRAVYSMPLTNLIGGERALGVSRDPSSNRIWIFSNNHLAQLIMKNELCRIWQIYLDRLQFDEARQFCKDSNQMDTINIREAEYNFDNGNYIRAARMFARSSIPFEQIALRFCHLSSSSGTTIDHQSLTSLDHFTALSSSLIQQGYEINEDHDIMEALLLSSPLGGGGEKKSQSNKDCDNTSLQQYKSSGMSKLSISNQVKNNLFSPPSSMSMSSTHPSSFGPLKIFISAKLDYLIEQKNQKGGNKSSLGNSLSGQIILLAMWLIELLLTELSFTRDRLTKQNYNYHHIGEVEEKSKNNDGNDTMTVTLQNHLATVKREFRTILTSPEVLKFLPNAKFVIYDLLESHGENDELIYFTELMGDYSRLVDHYMRQCMYNEALKLLASQPTCINRFYEYASCLASKSPEEFVNVCIRLDNKLESNKLLPCIMLLPENQAIRYLEHTITKHSYTNSGGTHQAVHHMLISLYANEYRTTTNNSNNNQQKKDGKSDKLLDYLEKFSVQAINMRKIKQHQQHANGNIDGNADDSTLDANSYFPSLDFDLSELSLLDRQYNNDGGNNEMTSSGNPANPLKFLNSQYDQLNAEQHIQSLLPYDPGFVLRLCKEVGHLKGMIYMLQILDMHQEALQLAIEWNEIGLAKEIAQSDFLNSNLRRQLWIQLAQHIISTNGNMQEAINLLRECPLLKLEDILPYFHQFVTIDQFKDLICASLDSYNERIENVKNEMQTTMKTIDELRTQSNNLRYRYQIVENDSRCMHCNHLLILRAFYLFPCGHNFHINCLTELVKPYLSAEQKLKLSKAVDSENIGNTASVTSFEDIFDEIIADDCILCGRIAIENLSRLYYTDQGSYEKELSIWQ